MYSFFSTMATIEYIRWSLESKLSELRGEIRRIERLLERVKDVKEDTMSILGNNFFNPRVDVPQISEWDNSSFRYFFLKVSIKMSPQ